MLRESLILYVPARQVSQTDSWGDDDFDSDEELKHDEPNNVNYSAPTETKTYQDTGSRPN